ncbi:hypothetical protein MOF23_07595 [Bacillus inaquosorum]|uniref:hypothetical protein n=1 Tax=Bacillus inaquosorum TaxID=483913 RepID=UPI002282D70E|nr:hypothetical protein [Bacillus inaquosorum]MCY9308832.1 hypothetical protein [Bacillus inaquosorum]
MLAYIRLIIGQNGKVLKIFEDSLYHPDQQSYEYIQELLTWRGASFDYVDSSINNAEVLVLFHPETFEISHPLDPVEFETDFVIKRVIILQENIKETMKKDIEDYISSYSGCDVPPTEIENKIGEWEELFEEDYFKKNK